jgi:hypothetical protein
MTELLTSLSENAGRRYEHLCSFAQGTDSLHQWRRALKDEKAAPLWELCLVWDEQEYFGRGPMQRLGILGAKCARGKQQKLTRGVVGWKGSNLNLHGSKTANGLASTLANLKVNPD